MESERVNALPTPKGVIYFDVPMGEESPALFVAALQKSIGWTVDPILVRIKLYQQRCITNNLSYPSFCGTPILLMIQT